MINDNEEQFENPDIDPGFNGRQDDEALEGREDERDDNIDSDISIKEMREGKMDDDQDSPSPTEGDEPSEGGQGNDALNYKNDREHGAFNPKNI